MKTTGLNLTQAHESCVKYRRSREKCPYYRYPPYARISVKNATATDYELEPEGKLLTREEVRHKMAQHTSLDSSTIAEVCDNLFDEELV